MSRAVLSHGVHGFVLLAVASCATVSGLADKETVDCPGGCVDGATPPVPTTTTDGAPPDAIADSGPPPPDAEPNFVKPDGWELVAVAVTANGAAPPGCPTGFDDASDVGTNPTAGANTCECSCSVTQQALCTGDPDLATSDPGSDVCNIGVNTGGALYSNDPAGGCNADLTPGIDRTGRHLKVKLKPPSGGACGPPAATPRPERVQLTDGRRVCDETSRCNGNLCDATVPSPFSACLASTKGSGDRECPPDFPTKLVAGRANVTCNAAACSCAVATTPCTGTFTYYTDANCTQGAGGVVADDTCRNPNTVGNQYIRYKIAATTTTSCTPSGTSAATVTPADVRTVCCR